MQVDRLTINLECQGIRRSQEAAAGADGDEEEEVSEGEDGAW